ncbi:hypothetical protein, partial [Campylobacter troglodytis]|uniref:hypothetical protein n=1 Tax=Campylobacter troglodytis TaxID=654363 RepID=UPI00163CD4BB
NILECMLDTKKPIPFVFTDAVNLAFIGAIKAYKLNDLDRAHFYKNTYKARFDNTLKSYQSNFKDEIYTIDTNQSISLQAFVVKSSVNKSLNENLKDLNLKQIKWGYKIISSTLKTSLNNYAKINTEKDLSLLKDKEGANISLNLNEINQNFKANEHILDNSGNNIIFFAYTKENGKVHNLSYTQPPLPARIKTVQC